MKTQSLMISTLSLLLIHLLAACGSDTAPSESQEVTDTPEPICTEIQDVECVDNMVLDLSLQNSVATTSVTTRRESENWVTFVDATTGGFGNSSSNPWIYIRFTESGAEKVEINDNQALESMDWHLAAHRFKLRLNSGSGGPSCVSAAVLLESEYDNISEVPANLTFYKDNFYTADCTLIQDSYGLGSPQVYMSNWWTYEGCVATTSVPFIIQLDNGQVIKLKVEEYYQEGQANCNATNATGTGGGNFKLRWRHL
ncbi:MAG: hypothetical protein HOI23_19240 [Deltaproteobacteria bacterium]|jgi:hypothetical protein|nr:hypothetical protein [Deltaproteobacteria bacterium]MBT6433994.1 hypothetical protein [Deltaproteobacteria bacterium]MBT6492568.1 hypothetical protein [Deltaproteobacteria bacterium]